MSFLSDNAKRMIELRDQVFSVWESQVREKLMQARDLQHPILIDTLPVFYDNITQGITPGYPRTSAIDGTTVASEHGGERARVTTYDHRALIQEYQILRWAIFDVMHANQVVLDHQETHVINSSIDSGIQEAVEAFFLVHSGLRERFAASLTHDLRGPLTAANTVFELILLTNDLTKIKTVAARGLMNTKRMSNMIDELLHAMAFHGGQRIETKLTDVDINFLVSEVKGEAIIAYGPRFQLFGSSSNGYWDATAIKRALENLIGNAVKYGRPGTPITIKIAELHERLLLSVHNEGDPIPPDEQECIYQMYQRAKSAKQTESKGWGIGLPYVRAVAESHGGSVGLDSSAERGTTFFIDIPMDGRLRQNAPSFEKGTE